MGEVAPRPQFNEKYFSFQKRTRDILPGSLLPTLSSQISSLLVAPLGIEPKFQV